MPLSDPDVARHSKKLFYTREMYPSFPRLSKYASEMALHKTREFGTPRISGSCLRDSTMPGGGAMALAATLEWNHVQDPCLYPQRPLCLEAGYSFLRVCFSP